MGTWLHSAGLTPNDPDLQGDLPDGADTSVDAVVGIYGRYDWEDRSTEERDRFVDFLERIVVGRKLDRYPEIFRQASADRAESIPTLRRSWSSTAPVTASFRWRRPAVSSTGSRPCREPWSATLSCPARATPST